MHSVELVVLFLLIAVAALTMLARIVGVPYPILLVVGGSLVGFAPGVPGGRARAGPRPVHLPAAAAVQRGLLLVRARPARRPAPDHAERGRSRAPDDLRRRRDEEWTRDDTVQRMLGVYEFRHRRLRQRAGALEDGDDEEDHDLDERSRGYQSMVRQVIEAQRRRIIELRDEGVISDDVLHALERELDLEDQRLEI